MRRAANGELCRRSPSQPLARTPGHDGGRKGLTWPKLSLSWLRKAEVPHGGPRCRHTGWDAPRGSAQGLGDEDGSDMTGRAAAGREIMALGTSRPGDLRDIANLGLTLPEAKRLLARVQHEVVAVQARDHAALRPDCASCGGRRQVEDWRSRRIATPLPRRALDTLGRTDDAELTAFAGGCPGLRSILAGAGVASPPILGWSHLSMRLQHAKQAAEGWPASELGRLQAKAEIVAEAERLRWRTWNGKAKDVRTTLKRPCKLLPTLKGGTAHKLKRARAAVGRHLRGQSAWLVAQPALVRQLVPNVRICVQAPTELPVRSRPTLSSRAQLSTATNPRLMRLSWDTRTRKLGFQPAGLWRPGTRALSLKPNCPADAKRPLPFAACPPSTGNWS